MRTLRDSRHSLKNWRKPKMKGTKPHTKLRKKRKPSPFNNTWDVNGPSRQGQGIGGFTQLQQWNRRRKLGSWGGSHQCQRQTTSDETSNGFLRVTNYSVSNWFLLLRRIAKKRGSILFRIENGFWWVHQYGCCGRHVCVWCKDDRRAIHKSVGA